jgi:hypothetical protein
MRETDRSRALVASTSSRFANARSGAPFVCALFCATATLILLASAALALNGQLPHNSRPLLGLSWILLLTAIVSGAGGAWLGIYRPSLPASVLSTVSGISAIAVVSALVLLVAALMIALESQPDPALYRVPSALAAVRAARALVPSPVIRLTVVEAVRSSKADHSMNDEIWHVQFESRAGGSRFYDVLVDSVSGESVLVP